MRRWDVWLALSSAIVILGCTTEPSPSPAQREVVSPYVSDQPPSPHGQWESGVRVAVDVRGTLDDLIADAGYTVEIAFPWQALGSATFRVPVPRIGDRWRGNLYATDVRGDRQLSAAWSARPGSDMHDADRFGILAFRGVPPDAIERRGPIALPPDRVGQAKTREQSRDTGVRDALIKRRVQKRRYPGEPAPIPVGDERAPLESGEAPH